jgi:hypothetical protein
MKQTKRILSISIERMNDNSPDTSWLGEYSDKRTSEFSIDRAHDTDCQTQNQTAKDAIDQLERVIAYLEQERRHAANQYEHFGTLDASARYDAIDAAQDLLIAAQDELAECDCGRGEWNHRDKAGKPLPENTPEDVRKYVKQDYERMESLYRGDWSFIGIGAKAKITVNDTCQTITSGGLWEIESDFEESYLRSVEQEELSDLRTQLYELGFSKRAIAAAVKEMN